MLSPFSLVSLPKKKKEADKQYEGVPKAAAVLVDLAEVVGGLDGWVMKVGWAMAGEYGVGVGVGVGWELGCDLGGLGVEGVLGDFGGRGWVVSVVAGWFRWDFSVTNSWIVADSTTRCFQFWA